MLSVLCSALVLTSLSSARAVSNLTQYVDPALGVEPGPNDYIGAQVPFGLVAWNPINRGGPNGIPYDDRSQSINWFGLSAMNGGGSMAEVAHMVSVNACSSAPGTTNPYASAISGEVATPGFYQVHLTGPNVTVAVAAAVHSGIATLTYPASTDSCVVFDPLAFGGTNGTITINSASNQVTGSTTHNDWGGNPHTVYYVATFNTAFSASGTWTAGQGFVKFNTTSNPTVMMKIGISYVSGSNAQANLNAEIPAWDFNGTMTSANTAWNTQLNSIEVRGGGSGGGGQPATACRCFTPRSTAPARIRRFLATVDGSYLGFDGAIHTAPTGHKVYEVFSSWDIYRTEPQLIAIIAPEVASDIERTCVLDGQQNGGKMPKWTWGNKEIGWGNGGLSCAYIGSAYAFGATDIDLPGTNAALLNYATDPTLTWTDLAQHINGGDVSSQSDEMESCNADMGVAAICEGADDAFHYSQFRNRAQNIFNTWSPTLTDSFGYAGNFQGSCLETQMEEQVWCSPINYDALVALMGGIATANARLDKHTSELVPYNDQPYYNPVNEPGIHVPYAYNWLQAPWKTQALIRQIMTASYVDNLLWMAGLPQESPAPSGWEPNDDEDAMSAWYVWLNLGLYPAVPGVGGFTVTSPLFSYTIHLANGSNISVTANNASIQNQYIQSLSINGVFSTNLWIPWVNLSNGANLVFNLGSTANTSWGTGAADAPPSLGLEPAEANLALTATVSASSQSSPNLAVNAADGLTNTKWQNNTSVSGNPWLELDLGAAYSIDHWIVWHAGENGERVTLNTKNFMLESSTDNVTWVTVDTVTNNTANITDRIVAPFTARYVRLYITTETQGTDMTARIYDFQVFGRSPSTVTASSEFSSSQRALMAVDSSSSTKWCTANSDTGNKWLALDLGKTSTLSSWVVLHAGAGGESPTLNTKNFQLQQSADNVNWVTVDSVTNNTANVTDRKVTPFTARYVRLYITAATQTADIHARIYEFQLYQ